MSWNGEVRKFQIISFSPNLLKQLWYLLNFVSWLSGGTKFSSSFHLWIFLHHPFSCGLYEYDWHKLQKTFCQVLGSMKYVTSSHQLFLFHIFGRELNQLMIYNIPDSEMIKMVGLLLNFNVLVSQAYFKYNDQKIL